MKKKLYLSVLGMFLFLSMFSLVAAQPPFQQTTIVTTGIQVEFPKFEYLQIGESFQLNVHPFNASNGLLLDNTTTDCNIHAYYKNGTHAVDANMNYDSEDMDFYVTLPAELFTGGKGSYIIYCNASNIGGFASGPVVISPTGFEFTVSEAVLYGFVLLLLAMFLFFAVSGVKKAASGAWTIFYICLTYVMLYALVGIIYLLASNYLWIVPIIGNIFYMVWFIMGIGFLPFVIILSLYILGQEARAALEQDYMKQGYSKEEARELSRKNKR